MDIQIAKEKDLEKLFPTLQILRPNLRLASLHSEYLKLNQEGFEMAFIGDDQQAFSIIGFRTLNFFFSGKTLYIDDLITHPEYRGKGYAGRLLDWIKELAIANNYDHLSLDSGFHRKEAYRLYLNKGLEVESLHFGRKVTELKK
jgi:GNAT superfamily N-acetyltransferase